MPALKALRLHPRCVAVVGLDITTWILVLAAVGMRISSICAQQNTPATKVITVKDSQSPDGRKNVTITDVANQLEGDAYDADVRDVKTGKSLFRFSWLDVPRMQDHPTETSLEISWRADSNAFATMQEVAYGESDCELYAQLDDGKLYSIALLAFKPLVDEKYKLRSRGKGYIRIAKWLPHNRFVVEASDQRWDDDYWVTCHFSPRAVSNPHAVVDDVYPAPKR